MPHHRHDPDITSEIATKKQDVQNEIQVISKSNQVQLLLTPDEIIAEGNSDSRLTLFPRG